MVAPAAAMLDHLLYPGYTESDLDWMRGAACKGRPPEWWDADYGDVQPPDYRRKAKAVCDICPVQAECLNWALTRNYRHGVWGGKTFRERNEIARRRKRHA